jgi:hypothetical protein
MGIDGIGKKGPVGPPSGGEVGGPARSTVAGRPFEVSQGSPVEAARPTDVTGTALARLRAGEIDVNGYVDLKVDEATAHLRALPRAQLERVRAELRERVAADPALVDLVRAATGSVPQPPADD